MERRERRNLHTQRNPRPVEDDSSLIPERILDHASQRLFAVLIFAAIQCWKIYDILLVKADAFEVAQIATAAAAGNLKVQSLTSLNNFTFVLKYAFFDGFFLWLLPILNIPLLSFLPLATLFLTVAINSMNFVLTSNSALPLLSSTFVPLWNLVHKHKELTILGDKVAPQSSIDMNAHFRGKYTIQYLPESLAMLNPFAFSGLCLESRDLGSSLFPSSINLPIELNTTSNVGFILLQRTTPQNTVEFLNFTQAEIRRLARRDYSKYAQYAGYTTSDERVFYLDAEINQPGRYKIHRVLDTDGLVIRPYKSEFTIGHCPAAKFVYPGLQSAYKTYRCLLKDVADLAWTVPMVSAFGMMPLTVTLATYQNGRKINTFEQKISDNKQEGVYVGLEYLQSRQLTRNSVEQELLRAPQNFQKVGLGKLEFQVLSVSDLHGNERLYNDQSKDSDVNFPVELRQSAEIRLRDKSPARKLLLNSSKTLHVETKGDAVYPIKVTLVHEALPDESGEKILKSLEFSFNSRDELANGLQISEPGSYYLLSGGDKYCPCTADQTAVHIERPPLPSVAIKDRPITDRCVGTIGYDFDLSFTGNPPFEVVYEVYKNASGALRPVLNERGLKQYKKTSLKHDFSFFFKPNTEGNYILKFKSLRDLNYDHSSVSDANTFSTHIKKKSQFSFFTDPRQRTKNINLCRDQLVDIPVYFDGHFPFSFTHEIVDLRTGKVLSSQKHQNQQLDSASLHVPKFADGGEYGVLLRDVTDSLGCTADLAADQTIKIRTRRDTPLVDLAESAESLVTEGDAVKIPLRVSSSAGTSPEDAIVYLWTSLDGSRLKNATLRGRAGLVVRDEGVYRLQSFENAGCPGTVQSLEKTFTLRHLPKPQLTVVPSADQLVSAENSQSFVLRLVCQDDKEKVKVKMEGEKPFVISYEILFPSGRSKSSQLQIDNDEVFLPLQTLRAGRYQITFTEIFDARYTREKMQRISHVHKSSVLTYDVKAHPTLKVGKSFIEICEAKEADFSVPVTLEGTAPFEVKGEIISKKDGKSHKFTVSDLRSPEIHVRDFKLKTSSVFSAGTHEIVFREILDAGQCSGQKLEEQNRFTVSITKTPEISKNREKDYYCVGDRISYSMSGVSPFVVYYTFNDVKRRADLKQEFTRLATKPGDLAIVALQDSSAGKCVVNYTDTDPEYEKLKLRVHDLPTVEISHGDSIIKNVHEGDQSEITFKFIGTPPFLVTYVRTLGSEGDMHKRRKDRPHKVARKVVDTKKVDGIWEYEHTEVVSLQGTYEAIEVTDAFCRAQRSIQELL